MKDHAVMRDRSDSSILVAGWIASFPLRRLSVRNLI